MSPEVIARKLALMTHYMQDLLPYRKVDSAGLMAEHYKVERLLELLVMAAADIAFHLLAMKAEPPPASYRAAFLRLGELGILSEELGKNMALGAGLRNILVHEYEEIDYQILRQGIPRIIQDITAFMQAVAEQL